MEMYNYIHGFLERMAALKIAIFSVNLIKEKDEKEALLIKIKETINFKRVSRFSKMMECFSQNQFIRYGGSKLQGRGFFILLVSCYYTNSRH